MGTKSMRGAYTTYTPDEGFVERPCVMAQIERMEKAMAKKPSSTAKPKPMGGKKGC